METLISGALAVAAGLMAIPVTVFWFEIVAAVTLSRPKSAEREGHAVRGRVAILVPAHNESRGLQPTLIDIQRQLRPGDRLLVVADNCDDDTAAVAAAAGAEVAERHDPGKRGKGYALDFGIQHLASSPPEIVIMIDADCRLADGAIDGLVMACATTHRPVQALYLMTAPDGSHINHQVAEFAWRVKNWLRPLGLAALHLPCQLVGTGMAFPWEAIRLADLASGWLVEDLKLGLELAATGHLPVFCPSARVTSRFASSSTGAEIQRQRWEQGHIKTILNAVPRLIWQTAAHGNWRLMALLLDLAVPPLSLLCVVLIGMFVVASFGAPLGFSAAVLTLSTMNLVVFLIALFLAWLKCGRDVLPVRAIPSVVPYIVGKLGLYHRILRNRADAQWIRTDRTKSG